MSVLRHPHRWPQRPGDPLWIAGTVAGVALWFARYGQLVPFSGRAVSLLPLAPGSRAAGRRCGSGGHPRSRACSG